MKTLINRQSVERAIANFGRGPRNPMDERQRRAMFAGMAHGGGGAPGGQYTGTGSGMKHELRKPKTAKPEMPEHLRFAPGSNGGTVHPDHNSSEYKQWFQERLNWERENYRPGIPEEGIWRATAQPSAPAAAPKAQPAAKPAVSPANPAIRPSPAPRPSPKFSPPPADDPSIPRLLRSVQTAASAISQTRSSIAGGNIESISLGGTRSAVQNLSRAVASFRQG